jgi:hypothetical protein
VEEIEKSLAFRVDSMGFLKTLEVPEDDRLGFAILVRDGAELTMQNSACGKMSPGSPPTGRRRRAAARSSKWRTSRM